MVQNERMREYKIQYLYCCFEVGIHQSPTLTKVKKGKVRNYYKSDELI